MTRSPKFKTLLDLQSKIDSYFDCCDEKGLPYTIEDLALALGFSHRQDLLGYQGKPSLMEAINKAKLRVGAQKIRQALAGRAKPSITIFDLKNNHGYRDQLDVSGGGKIVIQTVMDVTPRKGAFEDVDGDD